MVPRHLLPPDIINAEIWLFEPNVSFLVLSYVSCCIIIILNGIEVHFIKRKWRSITRFEVILLNLAAADILSGVTILSMTIATTVYYVRGSYVVEFFTSLAFFIILAISSASNFVIVIGIERLSAIKRPLKHRISYSSKSQMLKWMIAVWVINLTLSTLAVTLDQHLNKHIIKGSIGSKNLGYAIAAYLLFCLLLIFILYLQIAHAVFKRHSTFVSFDRSNTINNEIMKKAAQKEKATIVVCALVVLAYLSFNIPIVVSMFQGKVQQAQFILMALNSAANPLIYFFKGRIEKYFAQRAKARIMAIHNSNESEEDIGIDNHGVQLDTAM